MIDAAGDETRRKEAELTKAFEFYQSAARNKDQEPEIFEGARIRYFALKNGDAWLQQEKKRVQSQKIDPEVDSYRKQYEMLQAEAGIQKGYTDSVAQVRDKQSSMKNQLTNNVDFLGNLLDEKEAKLSAYNRYIEMTAPDVVNTVKEVEAIPLVTYFAGFPASFLTVMDVVLAVLILVVLFLAYYKGRDVVRGILARLGAI